jgi:hypothetical protein
MRIAPKIELTAQQRRDLQKLVSGRRTEVRVVTRARIVLAASRGMENQKIATEVGDAVEGNCVVETGVCTQRPRQHPHNSRCAEPFRFLEIEDAVTGTIEIAPEVA